MNCQQCLTLRKLNQILSIQYCTHTIRLNESPFYTDVNESFNQIKQELLNYLNETNQFKAILTTFKKNLKENDAKIKQQLKKTTRTNDILKLVQLNQSNLMSEISHCYVYINEVLLKFETTIREANYCKNLNNIKSIKNDLELQSVVLKHRLKQIDLELSNENDFLANILNKLNCSSPPSDSFRKKNLSTVLCQEAIESYTDKIYQKAIDLYEQSIALDNTNFEAYNGLGDCFTKLKDFDKAIKSYNKSIDINSSNTKAYYNKGNIFYYEKNYSQAADCYNKAIELNPYLSEAFNNKGNIFYFEYDLQSAIECYEKAIELDANNYKAIKNKGLVLEKQKKYKEALICYEQAIEINANDYELFNSKGIVFIKIKKFQKAIDCFDKAIGLDSSFSEAYQNKGIAMKHLNNRNCFCNFV